MSSLFFVLSFKASIFLSMILFKAMAADLAEAIAIVTRTIVLTDILSPNPIIIPIYAKGRAKIVCSNFIIDRNFDTEFILQPCNNRKNRYTPK